MVPPCSHVQEPGVGRGRAWEGAKSEGLAFQVPTVTFFPPISFASSPFFEAKEAQSEVCPNFKLASVTAL